MTSPELLLSRDALLGLYLATRASPQPSRDGGAWSCAASVDDAFERGELAIDTTIDVRIDGARVRTTVGRALVMSRLPHPDPSAHGEPLSRRGAEALLDGLDARQGRVIARRAARALEALGHAIVERAGVSLGMDDLAPAPTAAAHIERTMREVETLAAEYVAGLSTDGERYSRALDSWFACSEDVWRDTRGRDAHPDGVLFALVRSGAAGRMEGLRRLVSAPRTVAKPSGELCEAPVVHSLAAGLDPIEHFASTVESRARTLREDDRKRRARLIERRLHRALREVSIVEPDCGTPVARTVTPMLAQSTIVASLGERTVGLVLSADVRARDGHTLLARAGERVDDALARALDAASIDAVRVRWPMGCASRGGVCARCAGDAPSSARIGSDAARMLASVAASLPERVFHICSSGRGPQHHAGRAVRVEWHGVVADPVEAGWKVIEPGGYLRLASEHDDEAPERLVVHPGDVIRVAHGGAIERGERVVDAVYYSRSVLAVIPPGASARVELRGLAIDAGLEARTDEVTGLTRLLVAPGAPARIHLCAIEGSPSWSPLSIELEPGAVLQVRDGDVVRRGDLVASIALGRMDEARSIPSFTWLEVLLEPPRWPEDHAVVAPADGVVRVDREHGRVWLDEPGQPSRAVRVGTRWLVVRAGDRILRGEPLTGGALSHHDLLRVMGRDWLAHHLADELCSLLALTGRRASLVHVGVVVRAMLSRVRVREPRGTTLRRGGCVRVDELARADHEAIARGASPALVEPVLTPLSRLAR